MTYTEERLKQFDEILGDFPVEMLPRLQKARAFLVETIEEVEKRTKKEIIGHDDPFKIFYKKLMGKDYKDEYLLDVATGSVIQELRLVTGLSQKELAEKIGTEQEGISRAENNGTTNMRFLEKIGKACGYQLKIYFEKINSLQNNKGGAK